MQLIQNFHYISIRSCTKKLTLPTSCIMGKLTCQIFDIVHTRYSATDQKLNVVVQKLDCIRCLNCYALLLKSIQLKTDLIIFRILPHFTRKKSTHYWQCAAVISQMQNFHQDKTN